MDRISPRGLPQGRDPKTRPCPVCRQPVTTAVYDDAYGSTARVVLPHGSCKGKFRATPIRIGGPR